MLTGLPRTITYYNSDWYNAHQNDEHVRWLADPDNDQGYYVQDGSWHTDPSARALAGGRTDAGNPARQSASRLQTLPIACAPGAVV